MSCLFGKEKVYPFYFDVENQQVVLDLAGAPETNGNLPVNLNYNQWYVLTVGNHNGDYVFYLDNEYLLYNKTIGTGITSIGPMAQDLFVKVDRVELLTSNPSAIDSDGDFLSDGDEKFLYNTGVLIEDTDGDKLLDGLEVMLLWPSWEINTTGVIDVQYGIDVPTNKTDCAGCYRTASPHIKDSDDDGLSDYEEFMAFVDVNNNGIIDLGQFEYRDRSKSQLIKKFDPGTILTNETMINERYGSYIGDYDYITSWDNSGPIWTTITSVEYYGMTNPVMKDSDYDGLWDIEEVMGLPASEIITQFPGSDKANKVSVKQVPMVKTRIDSSAIPYGGTEVFEPTNPNNADTDHDRIGDLYELHFEHLDPKNRYDVKVYHSHNSTTEDDIWVNWDYADWDGDGLTVFDEFTYTYRWYDANLNEEHDRQELPGGYQEYYVSDVDADGLIDVLLDPFEVIDFDQDGVSDYEELTGIIRFGQDLNLDGKPDFTFDGVFSPVGNDLYGAGGIVENVIPETWLSVSFPYAISYAPIIIASIRKEEESEDSPAAYVAIKETSETGFEMRVENISAGQVTPEVVEWLALKPGNYTIGEVNIEVSSFNHAGTGSVNQPLKMNHTEEPVLYTQLQTRTKETIPTTSYWTRFDGVNTTHIQNIQIEEDNNQLHNEQEEVGYVAVSGTTANFYMGNFYEVGSEWWYQSWVEVSFDYSRRNPLVFTHLQSNRDEAGAITMHFNSTSNSVETILGESQIDGSMSEIIETDVLNPRYAINDTNDEWINTETISELDWIAQSLVTFYIGFEGGYIAPWIIDSEIGSEIKLSDWAYADDRSLAFLDAMNVPTYSEFEAAPSNYQSGNWTNGNEAYLQDYQEISTQIMNDTFESHPFTNWDVSDGVYVNQNGTIFFAGNYSAMLTDYILVSAEGVPQTPSAGNGWYSPEYVNVSDYEQVNTQLFSDGFETYPFVDWGISHAAYIVQNGTIYYAGSFSAMIEGAAEVIQVSETKSPTTVGSSNWLNPTEAYLYDYQAAFTSLFADSFETYPFTNWVALNDTLVTQNNTHSYDLSNSAMFESLGNSQQIVPYSPSGNAGAYISGNWNDAVEVFTTDYSEVFSNVFSDSFETYPFTNWNVVLNNDLSITEHFVNTTSNISAPTDIGSHDVFVDLQSVGPLDLLTEGNVPVPGFDAEGAFNSSTSNVDSSPDKGTETNPSYAQTGLNSEYMNIEEEDTATGGSSTEWLDVNSFDSTWLQWDKENNPSPYLNSIGSGSLQERNSANRIEGWFGFQNTALSGTGISLNISIYLRGTDGDDSIEVYFDETGSGSGTLVGTMLAETSYTYKTLIITGTYSAAEVDTARFYIKTDSTTNDDIYVDHARLGTSQAASANYEIDFEYQWTSATNDKTNEEVCIYVDSFAGEVLDVNYYNSGWIKIGEVNQTGWNNMSATGLDSSTYTIQLIGTSESSDPTPDSYDIDLITLHTWNSPANNYQLDLEVQFTDVVDYGMDNEVLAIKTGSFSGETLAVDIWDGSWIQLDASLTASAWNNITIPSDYLDSATETLRFRDGTPSSDGSADTWNIDAVLLRTWDDPTTDVSLDTTDYYSGSASVQIVDGVDESASMLRVLDSIVTPEYQQYEMFFRVASLSGSGTFDLRFNDSSSDSVKLVIDNGAGVTLTGDVSGSSSITFGNWNNLTVIYDYRLGTPEVSVYLGGSLLDSDTIVVVPITFVVETDLTTTTNANLDAFNEKELDAQGVASATKGVATSGSWDTFGYSLPNDAQNILLDLHVDQMEYSGSGTITADIDIWDYSASGWSNVDTLTLTSTMQTFNILDIAIDDYQDINNLEVRISVTGTNMVYLDVVSSNVDYEVVVPIIGDPLSFTHDLSAFITDEYREYEMFFYVDSISGTDNIIFRFNGTSGDSIVLTIDESNVGTLTGSGLNENLGTITTDDWQNITVIYDYKRGTPQVTFILNDTTTHTSTNPVEPDQFTMETAGESAIISLLDAFSEDRFNIQGVSQSNAGVSTIGSWETFGYNIPSDVENIQLSLTLGMSEWSGSGTTQVNVDIWDVSVTNWVNVGFITIDDVMQNHSIIDISIDDYQDINNLKVRLDTTTVNDGYLDFLEATVEYSTSPYITLSSDTQGVSAANNWTDPSEVLIRDYQSVFSTIFSDSFETYPFTNWNVVLTNDLPITEHFVNTTSNISAPTDIGSHDVFVDLQSVGPLDLLTEGNVPIPGFDAEGAFNSSASNVDSSPDKGTETNPSYAQTGLNSEYMNLLEENTATGTNTEWLNVDSFDSTWLSWDKENNPSPYLDSIGGGSLQERSTDGVSEGWFGFQNTGFGGTDISLNISIYLRGTDGDDSIEVYFDETGSGSGTLVGTMLAETSYVYKTLSITGTYSAVEVNTARFYIKTAMVGGRDDIYVDHARLGTSQAASANYEIDFEYQWTSATNDKTNEEVCIYVDSFAGEVLDVNYYNSGWIKIGEVNQTGWNNMSVTGLDSSTYTIQLIGTSESSDSTPDSYDIDLITLHTWNSPADNYQLDLEVQFTDISDYGMDNEVLAIKTGSFSGETLAVDIWDGSWIQLDDSLTASAWNNITIPSDYLDSATETLRFRDGTPSSDGSADTWNVDAVLLRTWDDTVSGITLDTTDYSDGSASAQITDTVDESASMLRVLDTIITPEYQKYEFFFRVASLSGAGTFDLRFNDSSSDSVKLAIDSGAGVTLTGDVTDTTSITFGNWNNVTVIYDYRLGTPTVSVYLGGSLLDSGTITVVPTTFVAETDLITTTDANLDAFSEKELDAQGVASATKGVSTSGSWDTFGYSIPIDAQNINLDLTIPMFEWQGSGSTQVDVSIWDDSLGTFVLKGSPTISSTYQDIQLLNIVVDDYQDINNLKVQLNVTGTNMVYLDIIESDVYYELSGGITLENTMFTKTLTPFENEYRTYNYKFNIDSLNGTDPLSFVFKSNSGDSVRMDFEPFGNFTLSGSGFTTEYMGYVTMDEWHNLTLIYDTRIENPQLEFLIDGARSRISSTPILPDTFFVRTGNQTGNIVLLDEFYEESLLYNGTTNAKGVVSGAWEDFGYTIPTDAIEMELDLTIAIFEHLGLGDSVANVSIWDVSSGIMQFTSTFDIDDTYQNYTISGIDIDDYQDINNLKVQVNVSSTNTVYMDVIDSNVNYIQPNSENMNRSIGDFVGVDTRTTELYLYVAEIAGTDPLLIRFMDGVSESIVISIDENYNATLSESGIPVECLTLITPNTWNVLTVTYDFRYNQTQAMISMNGISKTVVNPLIPDSFEIISGDASKTTIFIDNYIESKSLVSGSAVAKGYTEGEWDTFGYTLPGLATELDLYLELGMFTVPRDMSIPVNVSVWNHTSSEWDYKYTHSVDSDYTVFTNPNLNPIRLEDQLDITDLRVQLITNTTNNLYLDYIDSEVRFIEYNVNASASTHVEAVLPFYAESIPQDMDNTTISFYLDVEDILGDANESVKIEFTNAYTGNISAQFTLYPNASLYLSGENLTVSEDFLGTLNVGTNDWYQFSLTYDLINPQPTLKVRVNGTGIDTTRTSFDDIVIPTYAKIETPLNNLGTEFYIDEFKIENAVSFNGLITSFRDNVAYARNGADGYWSEFGMSDILPPVSVPSINFTTTVKMWTYNAPIDVNFYYWDETIGTDGNWSNAVIQPITTTPANYTFDFLNRESSTFTQGIKVKLNYTGSEIVFIDYIELNSTFKISPEVHMQEDVGFIIFESPVSLTGGSRGYYNTTSQEIEYDTLTEQPIGYTIVQPVYNASTATIDGIYKLPADPVGGFIHPTITECDTCYRPFWFDEDSDNDGLTDNLEVYGVFNSTSQTYIELDSYPGITWTIEGLLYAQNTSGKTIFTVGDITNARNPDTDGDLLLDGEELFNGTESLVNGKEVFVSNGQLLPSGPEGWSSPLVQDSDGDFLLDLSERIWKTDPLDIDTDDDKIFDMAEVYSNVYGVYDPSVVNFDDWRELVYSYSITDPNGINPYDDARFDPIIYSDTQYPGGYDPFWDTQKYPENFKYIGTYYETSTNLSVGLYPEYQTHTPYLQSLTVHSEQLAIDELIANPGYDYVYWIFAWYDNDNDTVFDTVDSDTYAYRKTTKHDVETFYPPRVTDPTDDDSDSEPFVDTNSNGIWDWNDVNDNGIPDGPDTYESFTDLNSNGLFNGDNIGDWEELNVWVSSPLMSDTDNDLLDDFTEIGIVLAEGAAYGNAEDVHWIGERAVSWQTYWMDQDPTKDYYKKIWLDSYYSQGIRIEPSSEYTTVDPNVDIGHLWYKDAITPIVPAVWTYGFPEVQTESEAIAYLETHPDEDYVFWVYDNGMLVSRGASFQSYRRLELRKTMRNPSYDNYVDIDFEINTFWENITNTLQDEFTISWYYRTDDYTYYNATGTPYYDMYLMFEDGSNTSLLNQVSLVGSAVSGWVKQSWTGRLDNLVKPVSDIRKIRFLFHSEISLSTDYYYHDTVYGEPVYAIQSVTAKIKVDPNEITGVGLNTFIYSDPRMRDTDGDELFDGREYLEGTNPRDPDTDNDFIDDATEADGQATYSGATGYEVRTSPLIADCDYDGLLDGEELGHTLVSNIADILWKYNFTVTGTVPGAYNLGNYASYDEGYTAARNYLLATPSDDAVNWSWNSNPQATVREYENAETISLNSMDHYNYTTFLNPNIGYGKTEKDAIVYLNSTTTEFEVYWTSDVDQFNTNTNWDYIGWIDSNTWNDTMYSPRIANVTGLATESEAIDYLWMNPNDNSIYWSSENTSSQHRVHQTVRTTSAYVDVNVTYRRPLWRDPTDFWTRHSTWHIEGDTGIVTKGAWVDWNNNGVLEEANGDIDPAGRFPGHHTLPNGTWHLTGDSGNYRYNHTLVYTNPWNVDTDGDAFLLYLYEPEPNRYLSTAQTLTVNGRTVTFPAGTYSNTGNYNYYAQWFDSIGQAGQYDVPTDMNGVGPSITTQQTRVRFYWSERNTDLGERTGFGRMDDYYSELLNPGLEEGTGYWLFNNAGTNTSSPYVKSGVYGAALSDYSSVVPWYYDGSMEQDVYIPTDRFQSFSFQGKTYWANPGTQDGTIFRATLSYADGNTTTQDFTVTSTGVWVQYNYSPSNVLENNAITKIKISIHHYDWQPTGWDGYSDDLTAVDDIIVVMDTTSKIGENRQQVLKFQTPWYTDWLQAYSNDLESPDDEPFNLNNHHPQQPLDIFGVNLFDVPIMWGPNWNEIPDITIQDIYDMSPNVVWESVYSDLPINPSGFREESGGAMYQTWDGHYDNSYESSIASWNSKYVERENLKGRPIIRTEFVAYIWEDNYPNYTPNMYYGPLDVDPCEFWQFGFCNLDDGGPMEEYMENNPTIPHIYWGGWHYNVPFFTYDWISLYKTINDRTYPADPYFTDHQEAPDYKQIGGTRPSGYIGFAADDNYDGDYLSDGITNNYDRINYAAGSVDGHGYSKKNTYMYKPIPDTLEIIDPAKQYSYVTEDYVNPELPVPADGHYPLGSACEGYYDWGQTYPTKSGSQCGGWIYANEYQYYGWMDSTDDYPNDPDNSAGITTGEPHLPFNGYTYNWYNFATQSVDTQYKPTRAYTEQDAINYINSQQYIDGEPVAPLDYVYWYDDYKVLDFEEVNHPYYYWYGVHVKKTTKVAYETNYESYGYSKLVSEVDHFPTLPDADFDGVNDGWPSSYYTRTENYDTTGVSRPYTIRYRTATSYESYIQDSDNDGLVNALDVNSDNDAFPDGLEAYDSTTYNDWLYTIATDAMLDSDRPYLEIYDPYNRDSGPLVQSWEISNTIGYSKPQAFVAVNQTVTGNEYEWLDYSDSYTTGEILGYITDSVTSFNADPIEDLSFKVENIFVDINRDGTYLSSPDNLIKDAITDFTATTHSVGGSTYEAAEFALSGSSAEAMTKMVPWELYDIRGTLINLDHPSNGQTDAQPFSTTFDKEDYSLIRFPTDLNYDLVTGTGSDKIMVGGFVVDEDSLVDINCGGAICSLNDARLWVEDNNLNWMEITDEIWTYTDSTRVWSWWESLNHPSAGLPGNKAGIYNYKLWLQENIYYKNTTLIGPDIPGTNDFQVAFNTPIPDSFEPYEKTNNWVQDLGSNSIFYTYYDAHDGDTVAKISDVTMDNQFYNWAFNEDPLEGRIDLDNYLDDSAPTRVFSTWLVTGSASTNAFFRFGLKDQMGSSGDHVYLTIKDDKIEISTEFGTNTGIDHIQLPESYMSYWYLLEFELEATADGMDCRVRYKKDGGSAYEYDLGTIEPDSSLGNGGITDWFFEVYDLTSSDYWIDAMDISSTFKILNGELTAFPNPDTFDDGDVVGWTPILGYDYGSFTTSTYYLNSPSYSATVPQQAVGPSRYRYELYNGAPKVDIQDMLDTGGQTRYLSTWIRRNHYNSGGTIGVFIADYTTSSISGDFIKLIISGTTLRLSTDIGGSTTYNTVELGKAYDDITWHIEVKLRSEVNKLFATLYFQESGGTAYRSFEYLIYSGSNGFEGYVGLFAVQTDGGGATFGPVYYDDIYLGPTQQIPENYLVYDNPEGFEQGHNLAWSEYDSEASSPNMGVSTSYALEGTYGAGLSQVGSGDTRVSYKWNGLGSVGLYATSTSARYFSAKIQKQTQTGYTQGYAEFYPIAEDLPDTGSNNGDYIRIRFYGEYMYFQVCDNNVCNTRYTENTKTNDGNWWSYLEHHVEIKLWGNILNSYAKVARKSSAGSTIWTSGNIVMGGTLDWWTGPTVISSRGGWASGNYGINSFDSIRYGSSGVLMNENDFDIISETNKTVEKSVTDHSKPGDQYLWDSTFNYEGMTQLELLSSQITPLNQTSPQTTDLYQPLLIESIGNNMWQSWNLNTIPTDYPIGPAMINNTYNATINGQNETIFTTRQLEITNTLPFNQTMQSYIQNVYGKMNSTDLSSLSYEEKITLMQLLRFAGESARNKDYRSNIAEYLRQFSGLTLEETLSSIIDPPDNSEIALIAAVNDYSFVNLKDVNAVTNDYLNMTYRLMDRGYHVYLLSNEYLTKENLNNTIQRIALQENQTTSIFFYISGHTTFNTNENINFQKNGTQELVLIDGTILTDLELKDLTDVWESEKQFFILNTCYAEGLSYELNKSGRMIISATEYDQLVWVSHFDEHTSFYACFIETWSWSLSIEENFIMLVNEMDLYPEILYNVYLYDFDEENAFYL